VSYVYSNEVPTWNLPNNVTRGIVSVFRVPRGFDGTTDPVVRLDVFTVVLGAATANVRFQLTARYIADTELSTKAADETILQTESIINTLNENNQISFTLDGTLIADNDYVSLHLERLSSDAADTFTGRIGVAREARFDFSIG